MRPDPVPPRLALVLSRAASHPAAGRAAPPRPAPGASVAATIAPRLALPSADGRGATAALDRSATMTSDTPSFGDLLARARAGDRDALHRLFGFVVDEHGEAPRLRDVARRRMPKGDAVRDLDDSDGVMLSALMRGYEEFAAFRGSELQEFVAWLRQILVRRIARRFRSPTPRIGVRESVDEMVDRQGADAATPSAAFARDETVRDVRDAVARLPDDLRIVVELRLDGLEAAAIAEALGLEAAAVRKREQRAREHLRRLLEA